MSHTVLLLHEALDAVRQLGYRIRSEAMPASVSGSCRLRGQKWLFLDLAEGSTEQLAIVCDVLARENAIAKLPLSDPLRRRLLDGRATSAGGHNATSASMGPRYRDAI